MKLTRDIAWNFDSACKVNKICFDVPPENIRPPKGIDCLELVRIQCVIFDIEANWDQIDGNLFGQGSVDAFRHDSVSIADSMPIEHNLFSTSTTASSSENSLMNDIIFDECKVQKLPANLHIILTFTHLLEAACYGLFQGPRALPADISLLQAAVPSSCLATMIPSMFNVDYIKVRN
jgi:hypothetical protein